MTRAAVSGMAMLAICVLAVPGRAQTPGATDPRTREVIVSVVDRQGQPVTGLTAADFTVREDGAAREVLSVTPADEPMQVALLIDDSEAASDATMFLREGLEAFLERLHGKAQVGLITVGERPTVLESYTTDTEALQKRVNRIFPRRGSGAYLLDAIHEASRALSKRNAERPVIVAVTFEGIDYSNRYYQQVLDTLRESGATLHVIAVGTPSSSMTDEMRNRNIVIAEGTKQTGGQREQVLSVSGLPNELKQLADQLTNQYVVTYSRPDKLIPPKTLDVSTTRRGATVHAPTRLDDR